MSPTTLFPLCSLLSLSLSLTRFFRLALSPTQSPVTLYVLAASLYPYQKAFFLSRGYIQSTLRLERTQVSLVPSTSVLSPVLWAATARRASTFFFSLPSGVHLHVQGLPPFPLLPSRLSFLSFNPFTCFSPSYLASHLFHDTIPRHLRVCFLLMLRVDFNSR